MKVKLFIITLFAVLSMAVNAQSLKITGKVIDNTGLEVIGGNVTILSLIHI